jgi:hypothetical protein
MRIDYPPTMVFFSWRFCSGPIVSQFCSGILHHLRTIKPQRFFWLSEKPAGKTLQYPAALEARTLGFLWFLSYSCSKPGPSSMQV